MDENNRPIRYYNINDPNDRPSIHAQYGPIHYDNIIEPDGLPSIDDEYPSIEFDDPPHPQHYHDARPDSNSLRGRHEPGGFNYTQHVAMRRMMADHAHYMRHLRQESPYFDPIVFDDQRRHARKGHFEEIGSADPYVGRFGFDPSKVEFEPSTLTGTL